MFLATATQSMISMISLYIVIFGVLYLLFIRPQKKKQKEVEGMLSTVEAGDSVLTTSGFYGTVLDVSGDTVIVEFGNNKNCRIPMQKTAIAMVEKSAAAKTEE